MIISTLARAESSTAESVASVALAVGVIGFFVGCVVLFIAGVVSVLRSRNYLSGGKAIWVLLMFAFPFLGPLVWFIWGRRSAIMAPPQLVG
ncbi:PLD nuclease N-terminal domain-containing protein [Nocardia sp. NPDC088792]|uniref:PLD nuclease N-terminal domain-containing protein n=1 Tax=Nocardia sp. NPDC088792 TaxID=3364332 RepID=UPI00381B46E8